MTVYLLIMHQNNANFRSLINQRNNQNKVSIKIVNLLIGHNSTKKSTEFNRSLHFVKNSLS